MAQGPHEVLVFEVAGQRFGLPGESVRELVRAAAISPWPRSPKLVEGVINVRGAIVPVLNVREWLGLPPKPLEPADHFVVVERDQRLLALRVDRAVELARLDAAEITRADSLLTGAESDAKVAKLSEGLVLVPDLRELLALGATGEFSVAAAAREEEDRQR